MQTTSKTFHALRHACLLAVIFFGLVSIIGVGCGGGGGGGGSSTKDVYYLDNDGDGYGDPDDSRESDSPPQGYVENDADCDDNDPDVNPGAEEVCGDEKDNDCDGDVDENCDACTDTDGDGYYAGSGCGTAVDCDDDDPDINPEAEEICGDGKDNDCDGDVDKDCGGTNAFRIPDTGQTNCYGQDTSFYDVSDNILSPCPSSGQDFYGQDACYSINPPSYTTLGGGAMVKDNVTGLIWENKTDDGSIHDKDNTYNWYDAADVFIAQLNAEQFGGYSDWRLPTIKEMSYILDYGAFDPVINTNYFPNTVSYYYWSATTSYADSDSAWFVYFETGWISYGEYRDATPLTKSSNCYVRAVRGEQQTAPSYTDNKDGTVTDNVTGLMWMQDTAADAMTWQEALAWCENLNLAGYSDWRLPNINELISLIDYEAYKPAIDLTYFPNTETGQAYWSSTSNPDPYYTDFASWGGFYAGGASAAYKATVYLRVRAVRIGQQENPACTDADGDGYYAEDGCGTAADCDDSAPDIHPGAAELPGDGVDNDCDGQIDEASGGTGTFTIPDTGQTTCYEESRVNVLSPCPSSGQNYYGQDACYTIHPPSYTILGGGSMVQDNVTGLIWENKADRDGAKNYANLHDADNMYTWYDSNPATNGGDAGTPGDNQDTEDFIDALNSSGFGGYSDWRLPTREELRSIVNYGATVWPAIDTAYFPDTMSGPYWSTITSGVYADHAWRVHFANGSDTYALKSFPSYVRAVRGGQSSPSFTDNGDGTVTDNTTGLMWMKDTAADAMTWRNALAWCENLTLAGHSDWRLPTVKELSYIADLHTYNPAIDTAYFSDTTGYCWTSTTYAGITDQAWYVDFTYGGTGPLSKPDDDFVHVRAVRGGQ